MTRHGLDDWFLNDWYKNPDPWQYATTPDDAERKANILTALSCYTPFDRAIDIGAGEGWLTKDLPALVKHAYEMSDVAAARLPDQIQRVRQPIGKYDLVTATGVLYSQYDWENMVALIAGAASRIVLTCNIREWEVPAAIASIPGVQVMTMTFPYRQYTQILRVFDVTKDHD